MPSDGNDPTHLGSWCQPSASQSREKPLSASKDYMYMTFSDTSNLKQKARTLKETNPNMAISGFIGMILVVLSVSGWNRCPIKNITRFILWHSVVKHVTPHVTLPRCSAFSIQYAFFSISCISIECKRFCFIVPCPSSARTFIWDI